MSRPETNRLFNRRSPVSFESQPGRHHFPLPSGHHHTLLGKALSAAVKAGRLVNRKQMPRGYFFPDRFPAAPESSV